jgi:hypothetical protein
MDTFVKIQKNQIQICNYFRFSATSSIRRDSELPEKNKNLHFPLSVFGFPIRSGLRLVQIPVILGLNICECHL